MKVFTKSEIEFLELEAVRSGLSLYDIMEKAGAAVAAYIVKSMSIKGKDIVVLCGKGNNGGDGFVCARRLAQVGAKVEVVLVCGNPDTDMAKKAFDKLQDNVKVSKWNNRKLETETKIEEAEIVVDAIFGLGYHGEMDDDISRVIHSANKNKGFKIAIDIPSGSECDTGKVVGVCFKAEVTINLTSLKPVSVIQPGSEYCGKNVVASVGIDKKFIDNLPSTFSVTSEPRVASMLKKRLPQTHKGDYGKLVMICGSYGMVGAAFLAGKGALRSGIGLLNMVTTKEIYPILAPMLPEAIFTVLDFSDEDKSTASSEKLYEAIDKASAVVIGCGLGDDAEKYVPTIIKYATCPIVADADAINYISKNDKILMDKNTDVIITPHAGEMARLTGKTATQIQMDRLTITKRVAREHKIYTVLKGVGTLIASPDGEVIMNLTGNAGMAKGGSGDILAGMIGGFLAQGYTPIEACTVGVYCHGRAGDVCAMKYSKTSMLPTDMLNTLPEVLKNIENK